jgi:hypothetical protein
MQKITFTTNVAKNTLEYLKLLLRSLQHNLDSDEHQILIFIDSDNQNCLEYLQGIKSDFKDMTILYNTLPIPVGYARNKTLLTEYAKHDIISYLQSDMVIGSHYDTEILKHVKRGRILSSTRVEPPLHGQSSVTITHDFGLHPEDFDFRAWTEFSNHAKREQLTEFFFAPFTYYKEDWKLLGGYDTVFRRAREDSDLVQRCLHAGIELVQTFSANVYHFTCVTSRGTNWFDATDVTAQQRVHLQQQADGIELSRFIRKWGGFNHGQHKLFKLDIDAVFKNYTNLQPVYTLEPFFSRIWVQTDKDKGTLTNAYESQHGPANALLNFTDDEWNLYKHLYRLEDFNSIINVGEPAEYSIKIVFDFEKLQNSNQFISNIENLYDMLRECEPGTYELDGVMVFVNSVKMLDTQITVHNPPFDTTTILVY